MIEGLTLNELQNLVVYHCKILSDRIAQPLMNADDCEFFEKEAQRILDIVKLHRGDFSKEGNK